jgi:hypothetical protein
MKIFFGMSILLALSPWCLAHADGEDNVHRVAADLVVPTLTEEEPAAGKRVGSVTVGWEASDVQHVLYLPTDWELGKSYPVIVEYPGNGGYRNDLGDTSEGTPESCMLGYGLSTGKGFLWVSLPFIEITSDGGKRNCLQWWGDTDETKRYCIATVQDVCQRYGGDASKVVLCGFSRGAIACNYIGLNDDEIAKLWCGFFCHSHYDGVRNWPYSDSDRDSALRRLRRLAGKPQWISHELDASPTGNFLSQSGVAGAFTVVPIPYANHSAAWILRDLPERTQARQWLHQTINLAGQDR